MVVLLALVNCVHYNDLAFRCPVAVAFCFIIIMLSYDARFRWLLKAACCLLLLNW